MKMMNELNCWDLLNSENDTDGQIRLRTEMMIAKMSVTKTIICLITHAWFFLI